MRTRLWLWFLLLGLATVVVGCGDSLGQTDGPRTVWVADYTLPCPTTAEQDCLLVRLTADGEWRFHTTPIDGFDYAPGYTYTLLVEEEQTVTDGALQRRWRLLEVIAQTAVAAGEGEGAPTAVRSPWVETVEIAPGATAERRVAAAAGQIVALALDAADPALTFSVESPDGTVAEGVTRWAIQPTAEALYTVRLVGGDATAAAVFSVRYPTLLPPDGAPLAAGSEPGGVDEYAFWGEAGETVQIAVNSPDDRVLLVISGLLDGALLLPAAADQSGWAGALPTTQPYAVQTINVGPEATGYTISLTRP